MRVYLCGPINGRSDDDCKSWRELAKSRLESTIDPMDRDYRGRELEPGIATTIVDQDKLDVFAADALLVYYDKPSVGTSMEIMFAYFHRKRIVLVDKSEKPLSPWLIYHCEEIYNSLESAVEALQ